MRSTPRRQMVTVTPIIGSPASQISKPDVDVRDDQENVVNLTNENFT
jgi:hypothetical protein